jgi:putative hydrolase of the HAD superfamily
MYAEAYFGSQCVGATLVVAHIEIIKRGRTSAMMDQLIAQEPDRSRRAVLLDLDDTLFDHSHSSRAGVLAVHSANPALAARPFATVLTDHALILEELHLEVLRGKMTIDAARAERFRRLLALHGAAGDADEASARYRAAYLRERQVVPGARELLEALRGRAAVAIVTNNAQAEQEEKLRTLDIAHLVDALVTSEAAGVAKPDPAIFQRALDQIGCRAEDAVMLGDSWTADVIGAQAAGIRAIWLNRHGRAYPGGEVRIQDSGFRKASEARGAGAGFRIQDSGFRSAGDGWHPVAHEIRSLEPTDELVALLLLGEYANES